jgi:hypothetical protein
LGPNLYFRADKKLSFLLYYIAESETNKDEMCRMMQLLTMEKVISDTKVFLDFALGQEISRDKLFEHEIF